MARTLSFNAVQGALSVTALIYYKAGWNDALSSGTRLTEPQSATELSSAVSELHVESPLTVYGTFHDDPTWGSFMLSVEEYRDQADAFERSLE